MNRLTKIIQGVDNYQRQHQAVGFIYSVIKKYGEDNGGYQSAVITYYGLLSLFPLLIVFTSLTQLALKSNSSLRHKLTSGAIHYFPVIGDQLQQAVHSPKKTGIGLIISLLIMFYGARGGASAFMYSVSSLWNTPKFKQPSFLKNLTRSFSIIAVGGVGLLAAAILSGYTADLASDVLVKIVSTLLSLALLWLTFIGLFKLAAAGHKYVHQVLIGALIAAFGLQILQTVGGVILAHELKGLNNIYGTFALVVGLMFWLYLQAQVILYAVEIDVVRSYKLYPRSLQGGLTDSDKVAYTKYANVARYSAKEKISVRFPK